MRYDTRGRPYYWLQTKTVTPEVGTDVYVTSIEGCISITPLNIDINAKVAWSELKNLKYVINTLESKLRT